MIEFVTHNAYQRFDELSVGLIRTNAAVCYWTMSLSELPLGFVSALQHKDSCLVVDIHSPTSIDSLAEIGSARANVFLYLFQIVGKTEVADSKGIPDHLMHAKVFVFDYGTDTIKIWVGSHNGTRRAMQGINFEFATVITCPRNSALHQSALRYILGIKNISHAFKRSEIDLYRAIQGGLQSDAFIELQEVKATPLLNNSVLSIFGTRESDYAQLKKVNKPIYLSITGATSAGESIYKTSVVQTGYLDKQSKALKFEPRRYAVKNSDTVPFLEPIKPILPTIYNTCQYFVTLKIDCPILDRDVVEAPDGNLWLDVPTDRYLNETVKVQFNETTIHTNDRAPGKFRVQGVNLGQADSIFVSPPDIVMDDSLMASNVYESVSDRVSFQARSLIRRKILVARFASKQ